MVSVEDSQNQNDGMYYTEDNTADYVISCYRKPSKYVIPLTKVNDVFFDKQKGGNPGETFNLRISGKNSKKEMSVKNCRILLNFSSDELPKNLTPYDGEVLNAVCSLVLSNQMVFTLAQIYETMAGKGTKSPQALESVWESMTKLRQTIHSFDWSEHAKMNGLKVVEEPLGIGPKKKGIPSVIDENGHKTATVVYDDNIIHAESVTISINGKTTIGYHVLKMPSMLQYAKTVKQIALVDRKLLDVPGVSNTEKNIVLKNELIKRLEQIRNRKTKDKGRNTLRLDTLFSTCGIVKGSRTEMNRNRNTLFEILDYYVKINYIKSYKKNYENTSVISVEIQFL